MYSTIQTRTSRHFPGNNYQSDKWQRINVNIDAANNLWQSRYYFPDVPELTNKLIVGIQAHIRYQGGDAELDGDIDGTAPNGYQYWGAFNDQTPQYSMLTLVNMEKEEIIQNLPCYMLFNAYANPTLTPPQQSFTFGSLSGKIWPIFAKLQFRDCYIFLPNAATTPNNNVTASFTFFYRD